MSKICAFEAIDLLNSYADGNHNPDVASFVQYLNDAGADMDPEDFMTLEEVMKAFVEEYVG